MFIVEVSLGFERLKWMKKPKTAPFTKSEIKREIKKMLREFIVKAGA